MSCSCTNISLRRSVQQVSRMQNQSINQINR